MDADSEVQRLRAQLEIANAKADLLQELLVELRESVVLIMPGFWRGKSTARIRMLLSDQQAFDRNVAARVEQARVDDLMSRRIFLGDPGPTESSPVATDGTGEPVP